MASHSMGLIDGVFLHLIGLRILISGALALSAIVTNWLLREFGIGSASTVLGDDQTG